MTAEQAARAFFEACGKEDWTEAGKFYSPITDRLKEHLGGLEILSLGQSFTSKASTGQFVPYEIKLRPQEFNLRLSNTNAAGRYVITGLFDRKLSLQQDLKWSKEPEVLPNNESYAKMSPAEVVTAYYDARSKFDWAEMRKYAPDYDVDNDQRQFEAAEKKGIDVRKQMPVAVAGEALWSAEQSAYFVKCRASHTNKHNLALRKDNPAGRWQVHGGI
jgi:murein L,D-transpeptidase YcbB/YkuD